MQRTSETGWVKPILVRGALECTVVCLLLVSAGCESTKNTNTDLDHSDTALNDPFNYKPQMDHDISGGDIGHLDRDGLKKDLGHVLNP